MKTTILIIGAGPYGLSLAAYLMHKNIDFLIVGNPLEFWKENMPDQMLLRSGYDWHLDPFEKLTFQRYIIENGPIDIPDPITKDVFIGYAEWFTTNSQINILSKYVNKLSHDGRCFFAILDDGTTIEADYLIIATGLMYFKNQPEDLLKNLSTDLYSHTTDLYSHTIDKTNFDFCKGKVCTIIGGRQSAFEGAQTLLKSGCKSVNMVYNHDTPDFTASDWKWIDTLTEKFSEDPGWYKSLSRQEKFDIQAKFWKEGRLKLEPWLSETACSDKVSLWPNRKPANISYENGNIYLLTDRSELIICDYILLATGFKTNIGAIPFLAHSNLIERIQTENSYPVLDKHFQSTFPNLFFAGFPATQDFGPFFGFTKGAAVFGQILGKYLFNNICASSS